MASKGSNKNKRVYEHNIALIPTDAIAMESHSSPLERNKKSNSSRPAKKKRKGRAEVEDTKYVFIQNFLDKLLNTPLGEVSSEDGIYCPDPELPTIEADTETIDGACVNVQVKKDPPSQENPLLKWLPFRDHYLRATLRREGRGNSTDTCSRCRKSAAADFRCFTCFGLRNICRECTVETHTDQPLHVLKKWNGQYWEHQDLRSLGIRIQLGHPPGFACTLPQREVNAFQVIHVNGVHSVHVQFCGCRPGYTLFDQLLDVGWWPSTHDQPEAAATEEVLRLFDHANGSGKITTYHWAQALANLTVPGFIKAYGIYRSLQRMMREYRHIGMLRRGGRGHSPGEVLGTQPGELAIPCRACPHATTIPDDIASLPIEMRWLYTLFVAIDANFRLRNRKRSSLQADPQLGPGWSYVLDHIEYLLAINADTDAEQSISHCSGFKALSMANTKKRQHLRATGVGMVACARHEIVRPQGIGDLQVGERYSNMDYIFFSSLVGISICRLLITYDIACQWSPNLWSRMAKLPARLHLQIKEADTEALLPKFHAPAHQEKCQDEYSLNYRPWVGRTEGEGNERLWSQYNRLASATKELGPGGRYDMIDAHTARQNWNKTLNFGDLFLTHMITALANVVVHFRAFQAFTLSLRAEHENIVDEWELMTRKWEADKSQPNPFSYKTVDISFSSLRLQLAEEEAQVSQPPVFDPKHDAQEACDFILEVLDLEAAMQSVLATSSKTHLTPTESLSLQTQRVDLTSRIDKLKTPRQRFMPGLADWLSSLDNDEEAGNIERQKLWPPSALPSELRDSICVFGLPQLEARIRHVDALDKLRHLRGLLRTRTVAHRFKRNNITGLAANTRANEFFISLQRHIHVTRQLYQLDYTALLVLQGPGEWQNKVRPLRKEDVVGLNERLLNKDEREEFLRAERRAEELWNSPTKYQSLLEPGEGKRSLSWIWYDVSREELTKDATGELGEGIRVEWVKTRARYHRWREEIQLIEEEMRRTILFGEKKAKWWEERANLLVTDDAALTEGRAAYAYEHAAFERQMAAKFARMWQPLRARARALLQEQQRVMDSGQVDKGFEEGDFDTIDINIDNDIDGSGDEDIS